MRACRLDDPFEELARLERFRLEIQPPHLELVREQDLVDDPAEPLGLLDDQRDEPLTPRLVEREVVTAERLRRAVDGRERRSQLMRRSRNELRLQLVEPMRVGDVAESVDRAAEERDARDRDPPLSGLRLERQRLCRQRLARRANRNALGDSLPPRDRFANGAAEHRLGREAGDRLGHRVPQADDSGAIEQEHAIADVAEHAVRFGARLDLVVEP